MGSTGMWKPLKTAKHLIAVYPFSPQAAASTSRLSEGDAYYHQASLEVGDATYAFESYSMEDSFPIWYRGYVVASASAPVSSATDEDSVMSIVIFPASHVKEVENGDAVERGGDLAYSHYESESRSRGTTSPRNQEWQGGSDHLVSIVNGNGDANENGNRNGNHAAAPHFDSFDSRSHMDRFLLALTSTIQEWTALLYTHLSNRQYQLFTRMRGYLKILLDGRRLVMLETLSSHELGDLRKNLLAILVKGNREQGLELVVRANDGRVVRFDPSRPSCTPIELCRLVVPVAKRAQATILTLFRSTDRMHADLASKFIESSNSTPPPDSTRQYFSVSVQIEALVASLCQASESLELCFSLFDKKFITEEFIVELSSKGVPIRPASAEGDGKMRTVFEGLSRTGTKSTELYLVCRIIKRAVVRRATSPGTEGTYRRPVGCAVLDIGQLESSPSTIPIYFPCDESSFATLHESIIATMSPSLSSSGSNPPSTITAAASDIIKSTQSEAIILSVGIAASTPAVTTRISTNDSVVTPRLDFTDVVSPSETRNDLYIKLWNASFAGAKPMSNVEVTVELRRSDGIRCERMMSRGTGEERISTYKSIVYSNHSPTFGELIKVEPLEDCHLFFTFQSWSPSPNANSTATVVDKPFAFAFFPLFPLSSASTVIPSSDGNHQLPVYKYNRTLASPAVYLCPEAPTTLVPTSHSFVIRSLLVSTRYTQNVTLANLFDWERLIEDQVEMESVLARVKFCDEKEISKFLRSIFDALFGIASTNSSHDASVFSALVAVLAILSDRRFSQSHAVITEYTDQYFSDTFNTRFIIASLRSLVREPSSDGQLLRSSLKVAPHLLRFAVGSKRRNVNEIDGLFEDLNSLMRSESPVLLGTQTLAIHSFINSLSSLDLIFDHQKLASIAIAFIDSIRKEISSTVKLGVLDQLVTSSTCESSKGRALIVLEMVGWMRSSRSWIRGVGSSIQILAQLLHLSFAALQQLQPDDSTRSGPDVRLMETEQDNLEYLLNLLPLLLDSYGEVQLDDSDSTIRGNLASVIITLLSSPRQILVNFLDGTFEIEGNSKFVSRVELLLSTATSIITFGFPVEWISFDTLARSALLNLVAPICDILEREFGQIQLDTSILTLWKSVIDLLLNVITDSRYQLEALSIPKRRRLLFLTDQRDIRVEASRLLDRFWNLISSRAGESYLTSLIQIDDALSLCSSRSAVASEVGIIILQSLITNEFHLSRKLDTVLIKSIDYLDQMKGFPASSFKTLQTRFDETTNDDDQFRAALSGYFGSIDEFFSILADIRSLPEGIQYQDDRLSATLRLLSFIRVVKKSNLAYIRFLHQLLDHHSALSKPREAGLALKLHAELYNWSNDMTPAISELKLPRSTEFARKESLYMRCFDLFLQSQSYELALEVLNLLRLQYERLGYNPIRVGELCQSEAKLHMDMAKAKLKPPIVSYYRVAFYGKWDRSIAGRQYVYDSGAAEADGFVANTLARYAGSIQLMSAAIPSDEIQNGEVQWLQITPVEALAPKNDRGGASFSFGRVTEGNEAESILLWSEKTILICRETFPNLFRRAEVLELQLIDVSPVSQAISDITARSDRLEKSFDEFFFLTHTSRTRPPDPGRLSTTLRSTLDFPTQRSPLTYLQVFSEEYEFAHPDEAPLVRVLAHGMDGLASLIHRSLQLHSRLIFKEMLLFHETLEKIFHQSSLKSRNFDDTLLDLPSQDATSSAASVTSTPDVLDITVRRDSRSATPTTISAAQMAFRSSPGRVSQLQQRSPNGSLFSRKSTSDSQRSDSIMSRWRKKRESSDVIQE